MENILPYVKKRLRLGPCDTLTLARSLEIDPKYLSAFLWQSGDPLIDFCPHKSQSGNIVWELAEMDLDEKKRLARDISEDFENEDNVNLGEAYDLAELIRDIAENENWKRKRARAIAEDFSNEDNVNLEEASELARLIRKIAEKENW